MGGTGGCTGAQWWQGCDAAVITRELSVAQRCSSKLLPAKQPSPY